MTTTKIKSVEVGKPWSNANGTFYPHTYELEDGQTVVANHKENGKFSVGEEVEYEVTGTDKVGNTKAKVSKPQQSGGGFSRGGGYKPDTVGITVGACLNLAVSMYNAGKFDDLAKIKTTADWLIDISFELKNKHQDKA